MLILLRSGVKAFLVMTCTQDSGREGELMLYKATALLKALRCQERWSVPQQCCTLTALL